MAYIEIVYREGHCTMSCTDYSEACHTESAEEFDCPYFAHPAHDKKTIPFGDCAYAKFEYKYKGWSGKKYEIEECRDPYNAPLDCMLVTLGKKTYECEKVILNGTCIYNEYDAEED